MNGNNLLRVDWSDYWVSLTVTEQELVHPQEKLDYPPAGLEHFTAWLGEMWEVPAVKEYGLTPQQHMEFRRQMGQSPTNYDFLL